MNPLENWSDIYDSLHSWLTDDISFYVEEATKSGGPVLELGCGTGRIVIPIAQAGISVTGLDLSETMLEMAHKKLSEPENRGLDIELVNANICDFSLNRLFKLIIIPFNGFLSLLTVEEEIKALENIKQHLEPDGKFIFNIFTPDLDMLVQEGDQVFHLRDVIDPITGQKFIVYHQSRYDNFSQIINVRMIIEELTSKGNVAQKIYRNYQLRYIHRWEMYHLLKLSGFSVEELYGDFNHTQFDEYSTEMVWVTYA